MGPMIPKEMKYNLHYDELRGVKPYFLEKETTKNRMTSATFLNGTLRVNSISCFSFLATACYGDICVSLHGTYVVTLGCIKRKSLSEHAQNVWIHIILYMRSLILAFCSPLKPSIVSYNSVCGQRMPRSACAYAQADLGLRGPHTPEDTFFAWRSPNNATKANDHLHYVNDVWRSVFY